MEQITSATIGRETVRNWFARHPEIFAAVLLFVASNLLIYTLAAFTHWLPGARRTNAVDFCRWDCNWFAIVLDQGYELTPNHVLHRDMANWAFFPLFPATAFPFRHVFGLPTSLALVVASRLTLFAAILSFLVLVREEAGNRMERFAAGALVAFNPYVIYAYSGYSEPIYFTLTTLGFICLKKRAWISAGVCGALVSATRIVGSVFGIAYLVFVIELGWKFLLRKHPVRVLVGLALCPLGLFAYAIYLHFHMSDALAFLHVQAGFGRHLGNPFHVLADALRSHHWQKFWGVMALAGIAASAWLFFRRQWALAVFLLLAILIPLSADTWGFARYLWWQPPFLFVIFSLLRQWTRMWVIYFTFAGAMICFMVLAWFSATNIVV